MIVDTRINIQDAIKYELIDLDTNQKINNAIWANDETGEYGILDSYYFGGRFFKKSEDIIIKKGNIKLIKSKYYKYYDWG